MADQTHRIPGRAHALQDRTLGEISNGCHWLELGTILDLLKNWPWNARHSGALFDQIRPAPRIFRPPKC